MDVSTFICGTGGPRPSEGAPGGLAVSVPSPVGVTFPPAVSVRSVPGRPLPGASKTPADPRERPRRNPTGIWKDHWSFVLCHGVSLECRPFDSGSLRYHKRVEGGVVPPFTPSLGFSCEREVGTFTDESTPVGSCRGRSRGCSGVRGTGGARLDELPPVREGQGTDDGFRPAPGPSGSKGGAPETTLQGPPLDP